MLIPVGIAGLALIVAGCLMAMLQRAGRTTATTGTAVIAGVMTLQIVLAWTGWFQHWERQPPPLMIVVAGSMALVLATVASRTGARLAAALPVAALVGFQAFRLPLELVMHRAATDGVMPKQMSYSGWNFDILTGATAIVVAWLAASGRAPRWLIVGWNVLGSALLLAIIAIAVASTPTFAAFGSRPEQLNTWIADPPYVWLPGVLVPAALFGHWLLWRKLLATK